MEQIISSNQRSLLNPYVLHLQKLGLELKCPLCLGLFKKPVLLPCTHIFCNSCLSEATSECPACKHSYVHQEVKSASFMENIVNIYKNLDATFNASLVHPVCSDVKSVNLQTDMPTLLNGSAVTTPESGRKQEFKKSVGENPGVLDAERKAVGEKELETGVGGVGFMQMEQMSPPFSSDSKDDGNSSDPNGCHKNSVCSSKRPAENDAHVTNVELNTRCISGTACQTNEGKRQKKNDTELDLNGLPQSNGVSCDNITTNLETKFEKSLSGEKPSVVLDRLDLRENLCAFCHTSECSIVSGPIVSYAQGKEVTGSLSNFSKVTHVHEKCISWAPQIYFNKSGLIKNLESEVARANKLKCASCGKKGAVLGCFMKSCQRSYHVPCAYHVEDCRWDQEDLLLLCPKHISTKFPREKKSKAGKIVTEKRISSSLNSCTSTTLLAGGKDLVLCGSALSPEEKYSLVDFGRSSGAIVSKYWRNNVTHVIAATDSNGACTRTLKVLMAILNGRWIVTTKWVKACIEAGCLVDPEPYEVTLDTHGCSGGPKAGRLRVLNNGPKLFNNMNFYFIGNFVKAFKNDLLNLVTTAGGTISEVKDQLMSTSNAAGDVKANQVTLVVYNADLSDRYEFEDEEAIKFQRLAAAENVAQEYGSRVVGHTWILESVAACSLLPFTSRS
uniref:BRCA1-associated RING domain protein 1 n=1 Tax=Erigeron canadensis TaxID=72917 RepID=UPI001CB93D2B|nr:BRCA1-associated RING domain protein 1 [Erigeron canadensis]